VSDGAIAALVTGAITITTMVVGFLTLWIKLKYGVDKVEEAATKVKVVEAKVDDNTALTKAGTKAAATNALTAANTAADAKVAAITAANNTQDLISQLNGGLDHKVHATATSHFDTLSAAVQAHAEQDDKNMTEIRQALGELRDRITIASPKTVEKPSEGASK
jgi:hypothetical protein